MRTAREIVSTSPTGHAFGNATDFDVFHWNNCRGCAHDTYDNPDLAFCPIIDATLVGLIPRELQRNDGHRLACTVKETAAEVRARDRREKREYIENSHVAPLFDVTPVHHAAREGE